MTTVVSGDFSPILRAISVYAEAARADDSLIISSGITSSDARVTDAGESYTGTLRWLSYNDSDSDNGKPTPGTQSDTAITKFLTAENQAEVYVKNVDAAAAKENSVQSLISKVDGLSFLGRQFGAVRARKEDANLRNILAGVGANILGAYDPSADSATGVKLKAGAVSTADDAFGYVTPYTDTGSVWTPLFEEENISTNRSKFFDQLLNAMTAVSGEFEESFYYLVASPETFNTLRKQNVLDTNLVQDGNLNINTLLGGKIRLIVTGSTLGGVSTARASEGLKVSYLLKAGAFAYSNVAMNNPTAIDTNVVTNAGFGDVTVVSRWGNIIHPKGYSYTNEGAAVAAFPANSDLATAAKWSTVAKNVNQTGIFPIFHG